MQKITDKEMFDICAIVRLNNLSQYQRHLYLVTKF